jgi:hypothetical protein
MDICVCAFIMYHRKGKEVCHMCCGLSSLNICTLDHSTFFFFKKKVFSGLPNPHMQKSQCWPDF